MRHARLLISSLVAVTLAALASPPRGSAQTATEDAVVRNRALLEGVRSRMPHPAPGRTLDVLYEGQLDYEAHYRRPGETRPYRSRRRFVSDAQGAIRLDWSTWAETDTTEPRPESFLVRGDSLFHRDDPGAGWELLAGEKAELARFQVWAGAPWLALDDPRALDPRVPGLVPFVASRRSARSPLRLNAPIAGRQRTVAVDSATAHVVFMQDVRPHPRLGDITDRADYVYGTSEFADSTRLTLHERDSQWSLHDHRVSAATDADEDSLLAPLATFQPAAATSDSLRGRPEIVPIAPGVFAADMADLDTRSLIVEFSDFMAVIEVAVGSANGERLVDAIHERWPSKPIRYVLFSHHHPHYTGGLRALIADGATVVTTPGNAAFVRAFADRNFRLEPDRQAMAPRPATIETFLGRREIKDATQRLVAVDIGARSDHTDEFVVFWLPKQKLVFEAEQGWVTVDGQLRATRRAAKFLQTLDEEKLTTKTIVQSWPMRGTERQMTRAKLEELIQQRSK